MCHGKGKRKPPAILRLTRTTTYLLTLQENHQIRGKGIQSLTQSREYCSWKADSPDFPLSNRCLVLAVSPLSRGTGGFHMACLLGYNLRGKLTRNLPIPLCSQMEALASLLPQQFPADTKVCQYTVLGNHSLEDCIYENPGPALTDCWTHTEYPGDKGLWLAGLSLPTPACFQSSLCSVLGSWSVLGSC